MNLFQIIVNKCSDILIENVKVIIKLDVSEWS